VFVDPKFLFFFAFSAIRCAAASFALHTQLYAQNHSKLDGSSPWWQGICPTMWGYDSKNSASIVQLETSFNLSSNSFEKEYNPVSVFRIQVSDRSYCHRNRRQFANAAAVLFDRSISGLWRRYARNSGLVQSESCSEQEVKGIYHTK
jgi:hypothetical protein